MSELQPHLEADTPAGGWRAEANAAKERLEALDAATIAISQELSLEPVLQLIVDSVRPLVGARYAALGIVDSEGRMQRFITSGLDPETRRMIGQLPRGRGLLGVIIGDARTLIVEDIASDGRRSGFPANHPPMHNLLGVPVRDEGHVVGNLYLTDKQDGDSFSADDARLVETFARHAGLAIHNARVHAELGQLAVLEDRERIAQDLHDGTIQSLYAVGLSLEDVAETIAVDAPSSAHRIDEAIDSIHASIAGIREFITDLRAVHGDAIDLAAGLEVLAGEFRHNTGLDLLLEVDGEVHTDVDTSLQLLRLVREALSNVARHAHAKSVKVTLVASGDGLRLTVSDDGLGFDTASAPGSGHLGLVNMRARAESLDGTLEIDSRQGHGTRVVAALPSATSSVDKEDSE
jgi:signal transduction histidine kinase